MTEQPRPAAVSPLLPDDPTRVGDFWLDGRLTERAAGIGYAGHSEDGVPVVVILLSEGAAGDAAARDRFAGTVNTLHLDTVVARGGRGQDEGRLAGRFRSEEDDPVDPDGIPLAPWVALANDGSEAAVAEADRILSTVQLADLPQQGRPSGPDYALPWIDRVRPGFSRVWPLPWPGRHDRAGWITVLASWLLMLLMALIAVVTVLILFAQQPPQSPPPPVPTTPPTATSSASSSSSPTGSPSESASSSPSDSASSSPSGSPSGSASASASASPSGSPSETASASPSPQSGSPSASAGGTPTRNSRL